MFLIVEGIDGSGKGTVIEMAKHCGFEHKICKERSTTAFKHFFKEHKDENIILDRYHLSEVVYGNSMRGKDYKVNEAEMLIFEKDIDKVAVILIDIDAETAYERIMKRDGVKEKQDLHKDRLAFLTQHCLSNIKHKFIIYNSDIQATELILTSILDKLRKEVKQ